MTLYQVCPEWEYNGRDDSDFYVVSYDDETDELERIMVGSTRFAGGFAYGGRKDPPEEVLAKAEKALARRIARGIPRADEIERQRDAWNVGARVRVVVDVTNRPRAETAEPCHRCDGSGKWVNPRRSTDVRACLTCKGSGEIKRSKAVKGAAVTIPAGTVATVERTYERKSKYGTWVAEQTVYCRTDDGVVFRAPLTAVIADRDPITAEEVEEIAARVAAGRNFYQPFATSHVSLVGRSGILVLGAA